MRAGSSSPGAPLPSPPAARTSRRSATLLYTRYLFVFEVAGIVLLVAMVGAIVLTHRRALATCARRTSPPRSAAGRDDAVVNMQPDVGQGVEL